MTRRLTTEYMIATYDPNKKAKFTSSHRKEGKCWFWGFKVIDLDGEGYKNTARTVVDARVYGTDTVNTACLWVSTESMHTSGSGKAGGYGYHRQSAALGCAIESAGFSLSSRIDGVGDDAMREALLAIARAVGVKRPAIVECRQ
jgi:hypothetical protein